MSLPNATRPKSEDQGFELDRVWLRFRDPAVESVFLSDMLRSSINFIRAYMVAGTCLYVSFGFLDYVVGGASVNSLWLIRYGIVVPILLGVLALTFFPAVLSGSAASAVPRDDLLRPRHCGNDRDHGPAVQQPILRRTDHGA